MSARDKHILFYSVDQNDVNSREFMNELNKYPALRKNFILICVSDPQIKIPDKIRAIGRTPVLIMNGIPNPLVADQALSYVKNTAFNGTVHGLNYGALNNTGAPSFSVLSDDSKTTAYNQSHNKDYNRGFAAADQSVNSQFSSSRAPPSHVTTYDEYESKESRQKSMDDKFSQMMSQRKQDTPQPHARIDGTPPEWASTSTSTSNRKVPAETSRQPQRQTFSLPFAGKPQNSFL